MKPLILILSCVLIHPTLAWADKDDLPTLLKEVKSKDPKVRASAARELGHIGAIRASNAKEAIPVLFDLLKKDKEAEVRRAAITALGQLEPDPERALPAFQEALKDKSPQVRAAAAGALGMLGADAKEAVPELQKAEKDKDKAVSQAAKMALRNINMSKKK